MNRLSEILEKMGVLETQRELQRMGILGEVPPERRDLSTMVPERLRVRDPELVSELLHWLNRNNMLRIGGE